MTIKILTAAAAIALAGTATAQDNARVGGAVMMSDMTIAENASNAPNLTTLVAAAAQADLVDTLASDGPFTVFAPTNQAFGKLSEDSVNALLRDENKAQLAQILTCHVVAGNFDSSAIMGMISGSGGTHQVQTVGGCVMTASMQGGDLVLTDENGRQAIVRKPNVRQSNGVVHVINRVLLPAGQAAN